MQPKRPQGTAKQPPETTNKSDKASSKTERVRSVLIIPSRADRPDNVNLENAEETEIEAQITIPPDGGWGWVVVSASFTILFILDGTVLSFGSIYAPITEELQMDQALIGLINSIAIALYWSAGPFTSALINRFGFRAVTMAGGALCSISLFCSYFSKSFIALCIFYGGFAGVGYCFINMSASLVIGFYFEKLRSLAIAIAATGSSLGTMVMFPVNTALVKLGGWRSLMLLHSGLFGTAYFLAMTFKPLLAVTVTKTTDDPTRTVTYLPNVSTHAVKQAPSKVKGDSLEPTGTEKLFSAVSNYNFPTAADMVKEGTVINTSTQAGVPGPSTSPHPSSKLTLTAHGPKGGISERQLKQVQSIMSKTAVQDKSKLTLKTEGPIKKQSFWKRLCGWDRHVPQSRPMYRDDAFYGGKVETLPAYKKSKLDTTAEEQTGLEYQLAVSRAVTAADLEDKKGVCTTATRRILATMMDPKLLRRCSFIMFVSSGFFLNIGYLIPYIFVQERTLAEGIDEVHCTWFVSVISFSNGIGRLSLGALACKYDPLKLYIASCFLCAVSTGFSSLSFNVYYQYLCCSAFGFGVACKESLRSVVLVQLYGLERLTNATGMLFLFQGIGCCISTPVASVVKSMLGFSFSFYFSGLCLLLSGIFLLPVQSMRDKEYRKEKELENPIIGPQNRQAAPTPVRKHTE